MKPLRTLYGASALAILSTAALAGQATDQGARALEQGYAAYLTPQVIEKGILTVTPDGDSYRVRWDIQKALDLAEVPKDTVKIDAFEYRLTPSTGGAWAVKADSFPAISFNAPTDKGRANGQFAYSNFKLDGLYDPQSVPFFRATSLADRLSGEVHVAEGGSHSGFTVEQQMLRMETRAKTSDDGEGVDYALAQAIAGFSQTVTAPREPGGDPEPLSYSASASTGELTVKGLRGRQIDELWRFAVAHRDDGKMPGDLKRRVAAVLPLWGDLHANANVGELKVEMPEGKGGMKGFRESVGLTGFVPDGAAEFGVEIEDLSVASALAPAWTSSLFPASVSLSLQASSHGWDQIAKIALDDIDLKPDGKLSDQAQAEIEKVFLDGHPRLVLRPGHLRIPTLDLTYEGAASLDEGQPGGKLHITADSLDKTIALVQDLAADSQDLQGALLGLTFVKGLAKTGTDGRLTWDVEVTADGGVTVNGTPMPTK